MMLLSVLPRHRALVAAFIAAALLVGVWVLRPKRRVSDEERIREAIDEMAARAGERDLGGLMSFVSDRYQGEAGGKQDLRRMLAGMILASNWVAAFATGVEVTVEGDTARASLIAVLARKPARSADELGPEGRAGTHAIDARFAREDEAWKVVSATRRNATPGDWLR